MRDNYQIYKSFYSDFLRIFKMFDPFKNRNNEKREIFFIFFRQDIAFVAIIELQKIARHVTNPGYYNINMHF